MFWWKNNKSLSEYSTDISRVLDPYHVILNMPEDSPLIGSPASPPMKEVKALAPWQWAWQETWPPSKGNDSNAA